MANQSPPYCVSSNGRYYIVDLPDAVTETDLSGAMTALLVVLRTSITDAGAIYIGSLGCLLTEVALDYYNMSGLSARGWRSMIRRSRVPELSSRRISLLEGPGVAHRALLVIAGDHGEPLRELLDFSGTVHQLPRSECEMLYGRAGYLSSLLWIVKFGQLSAERLVDVERVCRNIVRDIADESHWREDHFHWEWYGKAYLGAAHGTAGVIRTRS